MSAAFSIPTCNRPNVLRESLLSVTAEVGRGQCVNRILVLDDSRSLQTMSSNRDVVDKSNVDSNVPAIYIGRAEKQRLAYKIAGYKSRGIPPDVVDFALRGDPENAVDFGSGGSRNTALLLSAGIPLLSVDDDARFEFASVVGTNVATSERILTVGYKEFAEEYLQGPVDSLRRIKSLGRNIEVDVADWLVATLTMNDSASRDNNRRVRAVMTGIAGNRWYQSIEPPVTFRGIIRDTICENARRYRGAITSGYAMMQANRYIATDAPFFVTCCCGVDARSFLPPFPPDLRADDTVFMRLLRYSDPKGLVGHLPVMVRHDLGRRHRDKIRDPGEYAWKMSSVVTNIVSEVVSQSMYRYGEIGICLIGDRLNEYADLSIGDFNDYIHSVWTRHIGSTVANLESFLRRYNGKPAFWADDVHRYIDTLRSYSPIAPQGSIEQLRRLQRYIGKLGKLLKWWPDIWDTAMERNQRIRDRNRSDLL